MQYLVKQKYPKCPFQVGDVLEYSDKPLTSGDITVRMPEGAVGKFIDETVGYAWVQYPEQYPELFQPILPKVEMNIDSSLLTHIGSMNYILQVFREHGRLQLTQFQPRKDKLVSIQVKENEIEVQKEVLADIKETMERMKIAVELFQEFLDGKRDSVYYWENEEKYPHNL